MRTGGEQASRWWRPVQAFPAFSATNLSVLSSSRGSEMDQWEWFRHNPIRMRAWPGSFRMFPPHPNSSQNSNGPATEFPHFHVPLTTCSLIRLAVQHELHSSIPFGRSRDVSLQLGHPTRADASRPPATERGSHHDMQLVRKEAYTLTMWSSILLISHTMSIGHRYWHLDQRVQSDAKPPICVSQY